ncbi:MAG: hypothetical protein AAFQ14_14455 [Cyanobacteria bacterium J06621_12]
MIYGYIYDFDNYRLWLKLLGLEGIESIKSLILAIANRVYSIFASAILPNGN